MVTKRAVPMNSTDLIDVHNMFQLRQRLSLDINISTKYDIQQNIDTQQE